MRARWLLLLLLGCADDSVDTQDTAIELAPDADGDGYNEELDCNDNRASIYPDADEHCDGEDNDCDGDIDEDPTDAPDWFPDEDRDGHGSDDADGAVASCEQPDEMVSSSDDCDDNDAGRSPDEDEICGDALDNDCDGQVDEATSVDAVDWYLDADGDGYGDALSIKQACSQPEGYVSNDDDCLDSDDTYYPDAPESCDGSDHDCDGEIYEDDGEDTLTWYLDRDKDGYGGHTSSVKSCADPSTEVRTYALTSTDCDDTDDGANPGEEEICDGDDNNCDGSVDEGLKLSTYQDADGDGYGDPDVEDYACAEDRLDGYVDNNDDCYDDADDSSAASIYPGAPEYCNGYDDDCDDDVDEEDAVDPDTWYQDADDDGYGDPDVTSLDCTQPDGYVSDNTDCDDTLSTAYPDARESCDDIDNDCDGDIDEGRTSDGDRYYKDADGDGYGISTSWTVTCSQPSGYAAEGTDCDDTDDAISPGASEVCDDVDNDCDDTIDEDNATDASVWYRDSDVDGFGDAATTDTSCDRPSGYVSDNTDCDDTDAALTTTCP